MTKIIDKTDLELAKICLTGKMPRNLNASKKDQVKFINLFLRKKMTFDKNTPEFILKNEECILSSLENDITSAKYLSDNINKELKKQIIEIALKKPFIINYSYPNFLYCDYDILLNSIQMDCHSIDSIWGLIDNKHRDSLIEELIQRNYVLNDHSPIELSMNLKIIFSSIKKDIKSIVYAKKYDGSSEIMNYLFDHGGCSINDIKNYALEFLDTPEITEKFLNNISSFQNVNFLYRKNLSNLFYTAIHTRPTIKSFNSIFQVSAEEQWNEHKRSRTEMYGNVFGKICSELKSRKTIKYAKVQLPFLEEMEKILKEKYQVIDSVMQEYFNIYHSDIENKLEKSEEYRDTIARLSALYISKAKEGYKQKNIEEYYSIIQDFFSLKRNHPEVKRRIRENIQKRKLCSLYMEDDRKILDFILFIKKKYEALVSDNELNRMIHGFIIEGEPKINQIIEEPNTYQDYLRYKKTQKLIHRLNSNYISINGPEVERYKYLISYDSESEKYSYQGPKLTSDEFRINEEYEKKSYIFKKIKQLLMKKASKLEVSEEELRNEEFENDFPFNDEFFEFNLEKNLKIFHIGDLYECAIKYIDSPTEDKIISEELYKNLYSILIEQGFFWSQLLSAKNLSEKFKKSGLEYLNPKYQMLSLVINRINEITNLASRLDIDIHEFEQLSPLIKIILYSNEQTIGVLGVDVANSLIKNRSYTTTSVENILKRATDLACLMVTKDNFTVPRVEGFTSNYKYSMYDQLDFSSFLAGINTNACFKVDGMDNDFFHYCLLDKNGFILKIEDIYGNFIARAAGFRHGNYIYINQLRSIYDDRFNLNVNFEYSGEEFEEIIETFKQACNDIINTSQGNEKEKNKVEYIFVTKSYLLKNYEADIVKHAFGQIEFPMDNKSRDWKNFVKLTPNLKDVKYIDAFDTDFRKYFKICISSVNGQAPIVRKQLKLGDVEALYQRKRNDITVTDKSNLDNGDLIKINRTLAIYTRNHNAPYFPIEMEENSIILMGDNWYIICDKDGISNSCVLEEDERALVEFRATYLTLIEELEKNSFDRLDLEQFKEYKKYIKN